MVWVPWVTWDLASSLRSDLRCGEGETVANRHQISPTHDLETPALIGVNWEELVPLPTLHDFHDHRHRQVGHLSAADILLEIVPGFAMSARIVAPCRGACPAASAATQIKKQERSSRR